jgi:hypothetical protein
VTTESRIERRLPAVTAGVAVLGPVFGAAVLRRPFAELGPALGAGLLAQRAATWILVHARPYAGMAAVAGVASLLLIAHSPWQELLAAQGAPWVPPALAWATVRVIKYSRTAREPRLAARRGRRADKPTSYATATTPRPRPS